MQLRAICLTICSLFCVMNSAFAFEICGEAKQGELLLIKDVNAKKIIIENNPGEKTYNVAPDGVALVALHRDAQKKITLDSVPYTDYITRYNIPVEQTKWDIQSIKGVEQSKVTPNAPADLTEIKREQNEVASALEKNTDNAFWKNGFIVPVEGIISGSFGNQRIFNGIKKNPHSGADIAAPEGTSVKASGDGKVVLVGKDYFYTGNMVIIAHGQELYTIYAHLKEANVKINDEVKQGDVIGFVGKTGRATGAHLHWGAVLKGVRFNPYSLLDINNKKCRTIAGKYMGDEAEK